MLKDTRIVENLLQFIILAFKNKEFTGLLYLYVIVFQTVRSLRQNAIIQFLFQWQVLT